MFCKNCGSEIEDGALFCENCGARQDVPAPAEEPAITAPVKKRWPIVLFILAALAFALNVLGFFGFITSVQGVPIKYVLFSYIVIAFGMMCTCASAVLFILPTRNKPVLTAIPRLAGLVMTVVSSVVTLSNGSISVNVGTTFIILLAVNAFYFVDTLVRPEKKTLSILHLVFTCIYIIGCLVFSASLHSTYEITSLLSVSLMGAAFSIALFVKGKKE